MKRLHKCSLFMSERKSTGLITHHDRAFLCQKYRKKPILTIENRSQFNSINDTDINKLATFRLTQLGSTLPTPMIIMEPGDSLSSIQIEIGFPILSTLLPIVITYKLSTLISISLNNHQHIFTTYHHQ